MGWWWNSGTSTEGPTGPSMVPTTANDTPQPSLSPVEQPQAIPERQTSSASARDEESEREFQAWLKELDINPEEPASSNKPSTFKSRVPSDISPDSLYPREISCRSAFDYAFFCQSFGGQFVNVYRYGSFRSCSNHWQDFWLCMRTRQWAKEDREKAITDHYRKKAIKYKQGPSSEDVWEMRTEPVKDAFQGDLEALEKEVAEWKRQNPVIKQPWEQ